jgi:HlyD family secretion protein
MSRKGKSWKRWLIIALVVVLAAAGGGYYYYTQHRAVAQNTQQESVKTTSVRRGDLTLSATGAGVVVPVDEVNVGFAVDGTLTEVAVKMGDEVAEGDVLAKIDDLDLQQAQVSAQQQVVKAKIDLEAAKEAESKLQEKASDAEVLSAKAALATAQQSLADLKEAATAAEIAAAKAAVTTAQDAYDTLKNGPTADEIKSAELKLAQAKNSLWASQASRDATKGNPNASGAAKDGAEAQVLNAEISVTQAEMDLAELKEPATVVELQAAQAKVLQAKEDLAKLQEGPTEAEAATAEANVAKAQETLDDLLAGASEVDLSQAKAQVEQAEIAVTQAELSLETAQRNLDDTTLTSPLSGKVMAVTASVGERVIDQGTFITIADLSTIMLEVYVDETDMDQIALDYPCEVVLDALPDQTFTGKLVQIDPELVDQMGSTVIRTLVAVDADSYAKPQDLLMGLAATVDIIAGQTKDAILVPVEALRDLGDGEYAVFVMENGEPVLHSVTVGLQDMTYAEITSGLEGNETVSTGLVAVQ